MVGFMNLEHLNQAQLVNLLDAVREEIYKRNSVAFPVPEDELKSLIENHRELKRGITYLYQLKVVSLLKIKFKLPNELYQYKNLPDEVLESCLIDELDLSYEMISLDGTENQTIVPNFSEESDLWDQIPKQAADPNSALHQKLKPFLSKLQAYEKELRRVEKRYAIDPQKLKDYLKTHTMDEGDDDE